MTLNWKPLYTNEESDDVTGGSTKAAQHLRISVEILLIVFFKFGTKNVHHTKKP